MKIALCSKCPLDYDTVWCNLKETGVVGVQEPLGYERLDCAEGEGVPEEVCPVKRIEFKNGVVYEPEVGCST